MRADLRTLSTALRAQWDLLRAWLEEMEETTGWLEGLPPTEDRPSPLAGWTVADLVAHLGRALAALSSCVAAGPEIEPLSLGDYLAGYSHDAVRTAQAAHELSIKIANQRFQALDGIAENAFADLKRLVPRNGRDRAVFGLRGPIMLSDLILSRLIELVVHAEDLAPILARPAPVHAAARTLVAQALLDVLRRRTGADVVVGDARAWVLLAAGRLTWPQGVARGAILPASSSDGLPELTDALPLLR